MWWPILLVDGWLFWCLVVIFVVSEFFWAAADRGVGGLVTFLAFLGVLQLFSDFSPWAVVTANWSTVLIGVGVYFGVGILWSLFQWRRAAWQRAVFFGDLKEQWAKEDKEKTMAEHVRGRRGVDWTAGEEEDAFWAYVYDRWEAKFKDRNVSRPKKVDDLIPSASKSKNVITSWMSLWPFDMLWAVLHDLLADFWDWIFRSLRGVFQGVANQPFAKYR